MFLYQSREEIHSSQNLGLSDDRLSPRIHRFVSFLFVSLYLFEAVGCPVLRILVDLALLQESIVCAPVKIERCRCLDIYCACCIDFVLPASHLDVLCGDSLLAIPPSYFE